MGYKKNKKSEKKVAEEKNSEKRADKVDPMNMATSYEARDKLEDALRKVRTELEMKPDNKMELEVFEKVKNKLVELKNKSENVAEEKISDKKADKKKAPQVLAAPKPTKFGKGKALTIYEHHVTLKDNSGNPKYVKPLLERATLHEAKDNLDDVVRQAFTVLKMQPKNKIALELLTKVINKLDERGQHAPHVQPSDHAGPSCVSPEEKKDKKSQNVQFVTAEDVGVEEPFEEKLEYKNLKDSVVNKSKEKVVAKGKISENKADTKEVVEEKFNGRKEAAAKKRVKLVFGEDIRFAELQVNCSLQHLREVISNRFPKLGEVLVKYMDEEGDLFTITSDEELRWAETSAGSESCMRLYIVKTDSEQDPLFGKYRSPSF